MDKQNGPFRELEGTPNYLSHYVYEHPSLPGKVIREVHEYNFGLNKLSSDIVNDNLQALRAAQPLFDELTETYNIKHAGFSPLIGNSLLDGKPVGMIVSDKIDGYGYPSEVNPLSEAGEKSAPLVIQNRHLGAAADLLGKLRGYLQTKTENNEGYLSDIFGLDQYIYIEPTEDAPHGEFILVDVDPPGYRDGEMEVYGVDARKKLEALSEAITRSSQFSAA